MTTFVLGSKVTNGSHWWQCRLGYDVTVTNDSVTIDVGGNNEGPGPGYDTTERSASDYDHDVSTYEVGWPGLDGSSMRSQISVGGVNVYDEDSSMYGPGVWRYYRTISRTHVEQTITIAMSVYSNKVMGWENGGSYGYVNGTSSCSTTYKIQPKPSYTIAYNANGGSGGPTTDTKWYGETLTLSSSTPTRTNYSFYHWNTNTSNTGTTYNAGGSYTANSGTALYAIWNPIISYNANGGSGAPSAQTKTYGVNLTLSSTIPTRTNHEFLGWATSSTGSVVYPAGGTYTSNDAVTLYAVWKELAPKITVTEVLRTNATGIANILGGFLKVSGTYEIVNPNASQTPTFSASASQTVAGSTITLALYGTPTYSNGTFTLYLGAAPNHSGSPAYYHPNVAANVSVTISDTVIATTATYPLTAASNYTYPTVSITNTQRVTSGGLSDALGGYLKLTLSYSMMEATEAASHTGTFPITVSAKGYSQTLYIAETSPTGSITVTLGNGTLSQFPPDEATPVSVTINDYFATNSLSLAAALDTNYYPPSAGIASVTRCDSSGTADDLGGYLKVAILYNIYNSTTRKSTATLRVLDGLDSADIDRQENYSGRTYGKSLANSSMTFGQATTWNVIMPYAPYDTSSYEALIDAVTAYLIRTKVYDGYKSVNTQANVPVSPYTPPVISNLTAYRCTQAGNPEDDGMYCAIEIDWSIYGTASQTSVTLAKVEAFDPDDPRTPAVPVQSLTFTSQLSGTSGTGDKFVFGNDDLSQDAVYLITVTLSDSLNTTIKSDYIFDAFFPMDFLMGGHGVSFGKPAYQEGFNVSMKPYAFEQEDAPVYYYNTQPAEADVPVKPAIVIALDTGKTFLYY